MKYFIFMILALNFGLSCQPVIKPQQKVFLYHRAESGENGALHSYDWLVITNYREQPKTCLQLYKIAQSYIDTVKSNSLVSQITFSSKNVLSRREDWDSEIDIEERDNFLITFGFDNYIGRRAGERLSLNYIIKYQGRTPMFYYQNRFNGVSDTSKRYLDSILRSPEVLEK